MATMSSAEFLKFIDTIHHKDIDTVVDELDDRVLSGWIVWEPQPIKFAEDGEPIKVDDANDADYISNPSCIIGVYTSDEDVFDVEKGKEIAYNKLADKFCNSLYKRMGAMANYFDLIVNNYYADRLNHFQG